MPGEEVGADPAHAGDERVRRLARSVVPADGAPGPRLHVLVVTVDDPPDRLDATVDRNVPGRQGGRFGRCLRVRLLVVEPRR